MPVTSIESDPVALTMTVVADFTVPLARLWEAYSDPRQLESFWGPPSYPATFLRHDMKAGGRSEYVMTGPDGDAHYGYWEYEAVEPMRAIQVVDGFAGPDGVANPAMPTMTMLLTFTETDSGSRLVSLTRFRSVEEMDQLVRMGMEQGAREAMGQMDAVLADLTTFAATAPASAQILDETRVRIARMVGGSRDQVWRAFHEPELLQQWLLGPDGWSMPVCEVARSTGEHFRYEWRNNGTGDGFGMTGEVLASEPPFREVFTEQMIGTPYPATTNELTLTAMAGGTLLTYVITYENAVSRDAALATGMVDGMETSFARMEREVLRSTAA